MANGASRIFEIMRHSGTDTISHALYVTVNSIEPLTFKVDDKTIISSEFYVLSDDIIVSRLAVGQKLLALTFNNEQSYFIEQAIDNSIIKTLIIDNLNSNSILDSLSANQGRILGERVLYLENTRLPDLEKRVSNLENRMTIAEQTIETNATKIQELDRRISALENR